jgi:hypothetical protein
LVINNEVFDRASLCVSLCEACIRHKRSLKKAEWVGVAGSVSIDGQLHVRLSAFMCQLCSVLKIEWLSLISPRPCFGRHTHISHQGALVMLPKGSRREKTGTKRTGGGRSTRSSVEDGTAAAPAVFDKGWGHLKVCGLSPFTMLAVHCFHCLAFEVCFVYSFALFFVSCSSNPHSVRRRTMGQRKCRSLL